MHLADLPTSQAGAENYMWTRCLAGPAPTNASGRLCAICRILAGWAEGWQRGGGEVAGVVFIKTSALGSGGNKHYACFLNVDKKR